MARDKESFSADQIAVLEQIALGVPVHGALDAIVRMIEREATGMLCSILLLDRERRLRHGAAPSLPIDFVQGLDGTIIGDSTGSCGTAAYRGEQVIVEDIATHPFWVTYRDAARAHGLLACWSTPIFSPDHEVLGTFAMYYRESRGPTQQEVDRVHTATHLASIAIVRHRAELALRQSEARSKQLTRLYAVASSVSEALVRLRDPLQLFTFACRVAVEKGMAQLAWIGMYREAEDRFEPVARFGADNGYVDAIELRLDDPRMNRGPAARAMRTGTIAVSNDIANDPDFFWKREALRRRLHACAAVPLRRHGTLSGVFVIYSDSPDFFCEEAVSVLGVLADDIAFAVESAENELERQRLFDALRFLHDLSEATRATAEVDQMLPVALRMLGRHLRVAGCTYADVAPDGDHVTVLHEFAENGSSKLGQHRLSQYGEHLARGLRHRAGPLVVRNVDVELGAGAATAFSAAGVKAFIAYPLERNGVLRTIVSVHHDAPRDWSAAELRIMQEVVERCWANIEQKAAETQLRRSEALLRIAGRAARLGGWSIDVPELQLTWSDEVCAIHEVPPGTAVTREQAIAFTAPEFRERARASILACMQEGTPFDVELQIVTAGERRVWVRAIGHAERDPSGAVCRVQGAFQDIDDRRKLEEQLRQSQKMEAVGRLASGVAHDFNNLLSVILSYASFVIEGLGSDDPVRADIEEIRSAGERASRLTRQLLALGKQQILEPRVVALDQIVLGIEKMLRRLVGQSAVFSVRTAESLGRVLADPGQIEQVVMNLVVNARDAMPNGGRLVVETANVEIASGDAADTVGIPAGRYVTLAVTDSGVGIDAATRARIFEPFFTTKEKDKGTGLGLSIVYGIVTQSGGHIAVRSEAGAGTTFQVYFPQVDEALDEAVPGESAVWARGCETVPMVEHEQQVRAIDVAPLDGSSSGPAERRPARRATGPAQGGRHILLVDDEEALVHLTARILGRLGYRVTSFTDPAQAVEAFSERPGTFDAVVSDVSMHGMSGSTWFERCVSYAPTFQSCSPREISDRRTWKPPGRCASVSWS